MTSPIEIPPPLLDPVAEPELRGQTVEAVGTFIADGVAALREANGRISGVCEIVAEHNRVADGVVHECEGALAR